MKRNQPPRRTLGGRSRPPRVQPAIPLAVRRQLTARSGGVCEAQLFGCLGEATDPHHRITVKMGGRHGDAKLRHDRLSNLLHLCRLCHDWCGDRGVEAGEIGLSLSEHDNPEQEPVRYRGELVLLKDDGSVLNWEATGNAS